ncbi:MAG: hypothetical protein COC01_08760 [Bacteroidetes bacterium]|nr:MAG: hypothetical protein COC01_08760 [Bacteroidota bacterium]
MKTYDICPQCGIEFLMTRSDKIFHNLKCKNEFNNKKNSEFRKKVTDKKNRQLLKNEKALAKNYSPSKKNIGVRIEILLRDGFDPAYYIGRKVDDDGQWIYCLYNYYFKIMENNRILIIKD